MQTPERRQLRIGDTFLQRVRWPAQCTGRLLQVVLQQPGFSQGATDGEFVLTIQ
jgi:hypothetical protein